MPATSDDIAAAFERGVAAFRRGELPPAHPAEAEGWGFAENTLALHRRGAEWLQRDDPEIEQALQLGEQARVARGCLYGLAFSALIWVAILLVVAL